MSSALLGYTGFVGSNFLRSHPFDDLYNSSNLDQIRGRSYDLVVSAAARADSFRINQHGDEDLAEIDGILDVLRTVRARRFVLVSTVCVYEAGGAPDEDGPAGEGELTPYGRNRFHLEQEVARHFDGALVLRLPQLYGPGLKKGVVYDLMNDYRVEHIRPDGVFQYYDLQRVWADTEVALEAGIPSLNLATPPLTSATVAREVFGRDISAQVPPEPESPLAQMYTRNMTTTHADLFGRSGPYLLTEEEELDALRRFTAQAATGGND